MAILSRGFNSQPWSFSQFRDCEDTYFFRAFFLEKKPFFVAMLMTEKMAKTRPFEVLGRQRSRTPSYPATVTCLARCKIFLAGKKS